MKKYSILFLVFLLCNSLLRGQEKLIHSLNRLPAALNPSFHAFKDQTRIGVLAEFANQDRGNNSQHRYAYGTTSFENYDFQLGVDVFNNRLNNSGYSYTSALLTYTYKLRLDSQWLFYPAVTGGLGNFQFDFNNLVFQDQINVFSGQINANSLDPLAENRGESFFDVGVSAMFHNDRNTIFGLSVRHLNQPKLSSEISENQVNLNMLLSAQMGHEIDLNKYNQSQLPQFSYLYLFGAVAVQGNNTRFDFYQDVTLSNIRLGINEQFAFREDVNFSQLGASTSIFLETFEIGVNYRFPIGMNSRLFLPNTLELFITFDISRIGQRGRRDYSVFY